MSLLSSTDPAFLMPSMTKADTDVFARCDARGHRVVAPFISFLPVGEVSLTFLGIYSGKV